MGLRSHPPAWNIGGSLSCSFLRAHTCTLPLQFARFPSTIDGLRAAAARFPPCHTIIVGKIVSRPRKEIVQAHSQHSRGSKFLSRNLRISPWLPAPLFPPHRQVLDSASSLQLGPRRGLLSPGWWGWGTPSWCRMGPLLPRAGTEPREHLPPPPAGAAHDC